MEPSPTPRTEIFPGVWLDARRALFIAPLRLLVVSDLHWGYAVSHRAAGNLLPLWGDEEIARTLHELVDDYRPQEMLWLGDSLHTLAGRTPAEAFLRKIRDACTLTLLAGNHDERWAATSGCRDIHRPGFYFHHGDAVPPEISPNLIEVIGHHHPAAGWWDGVGTRLKLPALVASPRRLILPAFSPWAAGTPWQEKLRSDETLWAIAPSRIFAVKIAATNRRTLHS